MAEIKDTKRRYRVQIRRLSKGVDVSEYFNTKREADAFRRSIEHAIATGQPITENVQVAGVTFGAAVDAYLKDPAAFATRKGKRLKPSYEKDRRERLRWLKDLFGDVQLKRLTWSHIDHTLAKQAIANEWTSSRTRYQYEVALSRLFEYCRRNGWAAVNIVAGRDRLNDTRKRERVYTDAEWSTLLEKADDGVDMLGTFLRLAWETGCRKSELQRLRWVDISPIKHKTLGARIDIRNTKSGEDRVVFIGRTLAKLLDAHLQQYRIVSSPLVFPSRTRDGLYRPDIPFQIARTAAGLDAPDEKYGEVLNIHHIRHTWATRTGDSKASLAQLMSAGGWKTPQMAARYMKLKESQAMEAAVLLVAQ